MHSPHPKDCKCERCKEHEAFAQKQRDEAERRELERAVVDATMKYTGPPPHETQEHHRMCKAADALRGFEKKHGGRP